MQIRFSNIIIHFDNFDARLLTYPVAYMTEIYLFSYTLIYSLCLITYTPLNCRTRDLDSKLLNEHSFKIFDEIDKCYAKARNYTTCYDLVFKDENNQCREMEAMSDFSICNLKAASSVSEYCGLNELSMKNLKDYWHC